MKRLPKHFQVTDYLDIFHMLFDHYQTGVTVTDHQGVIIYYNAAQGALDEVEPGKALGQTICELYNFSIEDSPTMRVLRTGVAITDGVHFYRTRMGKLVNAAFTSYPLHRGSDCIGAVCFIQGYPQMGGMMGEIFAPHKDGPSTDRAAQGEGARPAKDRRGHSARYSFADLVGVSPRLIEAVLLAKQAAATASPVMLVGETGVGKEIFAQSIHQASSRGAKPYTAVNCSAMPETLLEGILFGTTRGAFTGAEDKAGLFEISEGGTLFLDEPDSMPLSLQSKLLRVLQEKQVRRIGDARERPLDVRIISSVSRNPTEQVRAGLLRPDFYYRLGVVRVFIPPLRERMEDMHLLAQHFLHKHSTAFGKATPLLTPEAMAALYSHAWPGNVRELEHTLEAALNLLGQARTVTLKLLGQACPDIFSPDGHHMGKTTPWLAYQAYLQGQAPQTTPESSPPAAPTPAPVPPSVPMPAPVPAPMPATPSLADSWDESEAGLQQSKQQWEEKVLRRALTRSAGNLALAARLMRISPQLMQYKMRKYGLKQQDFIPKSL